MGKLRLPDSAGVSASAQLELKPGQTAACRSHGSLAINYDQRAGKLQLGNSQLDVGSTHASVSGTLGENLAVHVVSRNLNDALPVLRALGAQPPAHWPVELQDSVARMDASIVGPFADPKVSGKADVGKLKLDGQQLDRVTATFNLDRSTAVLQAVTVEAGQDAAGRKRASRLAQLEAGRQQSRFGHAYPCAVPTFRPWQRKRLEYAPRHGLGFRRDSRLRLARIAVGYERGDYR